MKKRATMVAICLAVLLSAPPVNAQPDLTVLPQAAQGDWPWWRGPQCNAISADREAVTKWSGNDNVVWATNIPGRGHSSPVICGKQVFLTTADEATQKQLILAFDRQTGASLWSTLAHRSKFTRKYPKNSHASATQACDGTRVFSVFINNDGLHGGFPEKQLRAIRGDGAGNVTKSHLAADAYFLFAAGKIQGCHGDPGRAIALY